MHAVEFITQLSKEPLLAVPAEIADQLPKSDKARVIVLTDEDPVDTEWRAAGYEQFLKDDAPEDAIYDSLQ